MVTESSHDFVHPSNAFSTRCALPTGFMLVKCNETSDGLNNIRLLVHHNQCRRAKCSLSGYETIKVHHDVVTNTAEQNRSEDNLISQV